MTEKDKLILGFPREIKLGLLRDALKDGNFGVFLGISKILLDANISDGGIESDVIDAIFKEHSNDAK